MIEIVIERPEVFHFARHSITVMTRSDWGKKDLKLLKTPNHTGGHESHHKPIGIGFSRRLQTVDNIPLMMIPG